MTGAQPGAPSAEPSRDAVAAVLRPDWLAGKRWMRTKHRRPESVHLDDLIALDGPGIRGGPGGLDGPARYLAVVGVRYLDAATDRYAIPMVVEDAVAREPAAGDGVWRALARLTMKGGQVTGEAGAIRTTPAGGLRAADTRAAAVAELAERPLAGEQSNTSVILGDSLVLKLYRLLEAGVNPEVEVATFLTGTGFARTPAVRGSATYRSDDGRECALAMTQAYVGNQGDAWSWLLRGLGEADRPRAAIPAIAEIGRLTAELHAALASRPDEPAFPAREATPSERSAWRGAAEELLWRAMAALGPEDRPRLAAIAQAISRRLAVLDDAALGPVRVSRIHGDYHLGQLLVTADGFAVIDFEGEPARSLEARRLPASPLRDVAGMLRSLDYAARTVERDGRLGAPAAEAWLAEARSAFLDAYGRLSPGEATLLLALEVEKACYEVLYEATSRPAWTWLPLGALERMIR